MAHGSNTHFQYPQPDRYPCNPLPQAAASTFTHCFQYPQPDRYPCNVCRRMVSLRRHGLSVSSTGSISLQPSLSSYMEPQVLRPFSILNRIDIPATPFLCYDSTAERSFQYPQPDRYPCNKNLSLAPVLPWLFFQYPQPDRYPCNLTCCFSDLHACSCLSVSSTGSISLQLGLYPGVTACASDFQYPQPDRYPCNCLKSGWCAFA